MEQRLQGMSLQQQQELQQMMVSLQMKDGMRQYNKTVRDCFHTCVTTYRTRSLEKAEEACVDTCFRKFQEFQLIVQKNWQEENARMVEEQQVKAQLALEASRE